MIHATAPPPASFVPTGSYLLTDVGVSAYRGSARLISNKTFLEAAANIVPTDAGGLVLGRTAPQVMNVVYQNRAAVSSGGFFPAGVNGSITTSGAN